MRPSNAAIFLGVRRFPLLRAATILGCFHSTDIARRRQRRNALPQIGVFRNRGLHRRLRRLGDRRLDVGRHRGRKIDRRHPRGIGSWDQSHRYGAGLRSWTFRGDRGPSHSRPAGSGRAGHQVRARVGSARGPVLLPLRRQGGHARSVEVQDLPQPPPRVHPRGTGAVSQAAFDRLHRPLSNALAGPDHADRRNGRRAAQAQGRGENPCDRGLQRESRTVASLWIRFYQRAQAIWSPQRESRTVASLWPHRQRPGEIQSFGPPNRRQRRAG